MFNQSKFPVSHRTSVKPKIKASAFQLHVANQVILQRVDNILSQGLTESFLSGSDVRSFRSKSDCRGLRLNSCMKLMRLLVEFVNPSSFLDDVEKSLEKREMGESFSGAKYDELRLCSGETNIDTTPIFEKVSDLPPETKRSG